MAPCHWAHQYHKNGQHQEALQTYQTIVKNKSFSQSGRLRINMGNIYFEQEKFPNAIKMYRMALDQLPPTAKEVRFKVMRNIGIAFLRMGQYGGVSLTSFRVQSHPIAPSPHSNETTRLDSRGVRVTHISSPTPSLSVSDLYYKPHHAYTFRSEPASLVTRDCVSARRN